MPPNQSFVRKLLLLSSVKSKLENSSEKCSCTRNIGDYSVQHVVSSERSYLILDFYTLQLRLEEFTARNLTLSIIRPSDTSKAYILWQSINIPVYVSVTVCLFELFQEGCRINQIDVKEVYE
jgi:hypothetical protein